MRTDAELTEIMRKAKADKYWRTYKQEVTWGDYYIAPPKLVNAWVEVTYNEGIIFNYMTEAPKNQTDRFCSDLMNIFWVMLQEGYGCPMIIQVESDCRCRLLSAMWKDGHQKPLDRILQVGKCEMVLNNEVD